MNNQDDIEEFQEDGDIGIIEGEPTIHEIIEFAMAVTLDLENSLDEETNPLDNVVNININAGYLLYLCYAVLDMYSDLFDQDEEDMAALEDYVKTKKKTPNITNLKH